MDGPCRQSTYPLIVVDCIVEHPNYMGGTPEFFNGTRSDGVPLSRHQRRDQHIGSQFPKVTQKQFRLRVATVPRVNRKLASAQRTSAFFPADDGNLVPKPCETGTNKS